jgi:serine/threonine protein kinase
MEGVAVGEDPQTGDPQRLGPYRLVRVLGSGGMGKVFLGRSAGGRPVAVKVIRADLAADPEFRARFQREVAAARKVNGLYTALVVDADVDGPVPWLATAYVAGPSLADAVARHGPLPVASVRVLAAGLAEGLGAIHAVGLVHRDLKPSNVLLAYDGPRVIDFGISRATEASALTQTGLVVGSPGFMSPEQAEGREVGKPSDVFSLGAVLTFAATGHGPFGSGSAAAMVYRVVHAPPSLDDVPDQIRVVAERCLAKDASLRPTTAALLAELGEVDLEAGWLPATIAERPFQSVPVDETPPGAIAANDAASPMAATAPVAEQPEPSLAATYRRLSPEETTPTVTGMRGDAAPASSTGTSAQDWPRGSGRRPRGRIFLAAGSIIVVVAIVLTFVLIKLNAKPTSPPGSSLSNGHAAAASAAVIGKITAVPVSTLDAVGDGRGAVTAKPIAISGAALVLDGKPDMFYLGAEYCPYCAAERWAMIVALSRFGTFSGLATIRSAAASGAGGAEPFPNTATWTFAKASYSSPDLTFTAVETYTNVPDPSTGGYTTLQTPTPAQLALLNKYDAPPNVPSGENGAIPFIDFGNKYVIIGASYSPGVLAGLSWSQIAADLSNPDSPVAEGIDGTANYITAAICAMTGNQPASACTATVRSLESQL